MSRGQVKWFSESLGYGFIETPSGDRVLVRPSSLADHDPAAPLREGLEVEFAIRSRSDGSIEATSVRPAP